MESWHYGKEGREEWRREMNRERGDGREQAINEENWRVEKLPNSIKICLGIQTEL